VPQAWSRKPKEADSMREWQQRFSSILHNHGYANVALQEFYVKNIDSTNLH
jgi:hypothetical protein